VAAGQWVPSAAATGLQLAPQLFDLVQQLLLLLDDHLRLQALEDEHAISGGSALRVHLAIHQAAAPWLSRVGTPSAGMLGI
jgi:hypothetical protein